MTKFSILEITDRKNGYGMPVVRVQSSTNLKVINRGWNEFQCLQDIDDTDLLSLKDKFERGNTLMLEIVTPDRNTNVWYNPYESKADYRLMW